jgi:glycyl-tRNA synthetase beta chain
MTQPLLIEVGVEELPAVPLLKIVDAIKKSWKEILDDRRLSCDFSFIYTPRRLVIRAEAMPMRQEDRTVEMYGPPTDIAFKDGEPTQAALGFAKKCGVSLDVVGRAQKGGREMLYFKKEEKGRESVELLPEMVREWIGSMAFGKMMRWGENKEEFIRPVRWLQVRLGETVVDAELFGVRSDNKTYVHRMVDFKPVEVAHINDFETVLEKGAVTLSPDARRNKVLADMQRIEEESGLRIERDEALLDEVVAITEHPRALLGSFDAKFLELPPEVIMTSMKEHQRYFPVFDDNGLTNRFVVVSNAVTDDYAKVIAGNERVLRPRLEDALFFYRNDLKRGLSTEGLEKVQFIDGLGSLADKIERERTIAARLSAIYMDKLEAESGKDAATLERLIDRAVMLAKADLMSEMVYEFTELQGLMGYYYAKALGEDPLVYEAIKEQYMPVGEGAPLPSSVFSSVVAMSIKLDTLMGLFSVGKIPTGSKDPFALRRAVNGIVRIVTHYDLPFDMRTLFDMLASLYKPFDVRQLEAFVLERLYKIFKANPSVIKAVLESGERDINAIAKKVEALNAIVSDASFKEIAATFKRVANISGDVDIQSDLKVDPSLFVEDAERELYEAFVAVRDATYENYKAKLDALFGLKPVLDKFFDDVLVNAEDEALRRNRRNLVASVYKAFRDIADIKEVSV